MSDIFALIIVLLTAATGLVWLVDVIIRRLRRKKGMTGPLPGTWQWIAETGRGFFPFVLAVLIVRSFIVEPFHIPSGSMMPSVLVGDFAVTEKFAYGLRLPISDTEVIPTGSVHRGDVVVFRYPPNPSVDYIKRIIGLPGDKITYTCDNKLYINGKLVPRKYVGIYPGEGVLERQAGAQEWVESLPRDNGKGVIRHKILLIPGVPTKCGNWTVPPHEYFAMGDNRDNSEDSRYWGFVPEKNLVGKAVMVFFNFQGWTHSPLWHRIGTLLK